MRDECECRFRAQCQSVQAARAAATNLSDQLHCALALRLGLRALLGLICIDAHQVFVLIPAGHERAALRGAPVVT